MNAPTPVDVLPWSDPEFRDNPYPWYDRLRRESPVHRIDDRSFVVTTYSDVAQWAKDPRLSIADSFQGAWNALENTMLFKDPPEHTRLRRFTNKWFTPKLVTQWAAATTQVVEERLNRLAVGEVIEAHEELAVTPSHVTMCRIMQVPEDDPAPAPRAMITAMDAIVAEPAPDAEERAAEAFDYLLGRVAGMLEWKRSNPGDGMADALLEAHDAGELTYRQVLETITLFWGSAGHNPGFLVTAGLHEFATRPDVFEIYRSDPDQRQPIINELLRYHPAEVSFLRFPLEDIEIRGVSIPAGAQIRFMIAAANRDPEIFEDPDAFDHRRPPHARHLSFGAGPHNCAGQLITRAETEAIFTAVAERYCRIELAGPAETYHTDRGRNYRKLPIRLIP